MSRSAVVRELAPVSGSAARNTGLSSTRGAAASGCLASSKRSASRSVILSLAPSTARASIYQRASNTGSLRWAAPRLGRPGRSRCPALKAHMPSSPTSIKVTRAGSIRLHRRQGRRRAPASAPRCLHARRLSKLGLSHNGMTERPASAHLAHSRAPSRRSPFRSHSGRSAGSAGTRVRAPKATFARASGSIGAGGKRSCDRATRFLNLRRWAVAVAVASGTQSRPAW